MRVNVHDVPCKAQRDADELTKGRKPMTHVRFAQTLGEGITSL